MSDTELEAGDVFRCWLSWHDGWQTIPVRQFAILDVFGDYYFAPDWTKEIAFNDFLFSGDGAGELDLLNFIWPAVPGTASGIRIWAALLAQNETELICDPVFVEFSYGR